MRQEMMGFGDGSGISWIICKQSASGSRQITTPTPDHLIFTGLMLFLSPANSVKALKADEVWNRKFIKRARRR